MKGSEPKTLRQVVAGRSGIERVSRLRDDHGEGQSGAVPICEILEAFYEDLKWETERRQLASVSEATDNITASVDDVRNALKRSTNGRSCADDGLVAEILKELGARSC